MLILLIFLYVITISIYIYDIVRILKEYQSLSLYAVCKMMFVFLEGIVPLLIHCTYLTNRTLWSGSYSFDYSSDGIFTFYLVWFLSVVGYIFISLGYRNRVRIVIGRKSIVRAAKTNDFSYDLILEITTYIVFIMAVLSLYLWTKAYGGIWGVIKNANAIRSGRGEIHNSMAFFKRPAGSIRLVSYSFLILFLKGEKRRSINFIMTIISSVIAVLYCLAGDGRMTMGFFLLTIAMIIIQAQEGSNKLQPKVIALGGIAVITVLILILNMDNITYYIRYGETKPSTAGDQNILSEFSFLLAAAQGSIENVSKIGIRIVDDFLCAIFAWVPSRLKPDGLVNLWDLNTATIAWTQGQCPFGIVMHGFYDLNILGVAIIPFAYGILIKIVDNQRQASLFGMVIHAGFFYAILRIVGYSLAYSFMINIFGVAIFFVVYKLLQGFLIRKRVG